MATLDEQNKLVEVLKFTPRTYKIMLWGYGGEYVMGTVERKIYDYFKQRRLSVSDYAWGGDETDIPEEMQPFPPGSWYECSDMCHTSGVDRNSGTIQIDDENGETIYQKSTEDLDGYSDDSPEWSCNEEVWIDEKDPGTVVFIGVSNEKGTFFEADLELTQPFDATKLTLIYDEVDGNEIINRIEYDGVELDNYGGDTSGKSSDFGFYIAGSQKDGNWEKYKDMDDIEYSLTEWFPSKINPVHLGKYNVKTKDGYNYQAMWNGEFWHNDWSEEKIQVKEWQGIDHDPDADWDPVAELDKIEIPETLQQKAVWPYAAGSVPADVMEKAMTEEKETISKWWTVRTYYKKSCEQHEYFVQSEGTGRIKVIDGFRSCTYNVETNDGEFPKFEFTYVPGGNGDKDSLDLNNLYGDNIESAELVEMFDGGCWGDNEITGIDDEEEVERLEEFLSENGSYALEDEGEWYLDETEVWVWGPLEVTDEDGNTRIVIADENGNMVDFKE